MIFSPPSIVGSQGKCVLTTPRDESDKIEILSGTFEGYTLGTPIAMLARNKDVRPGI